MTNTQSFKDIINLTAIIVKLTEEEQKQKTNYEKAETQKENLYQKVIELESLYNSNWNNNLIGVQLDEAYDRYEKAYEDTNKEEERLEGIQEAIKHFREASGILEWLES